jgi:hypothetical protein
VAASLCGAARVARTFSTVSALRRRTLFDAVEIRVGMSVCMDQESRTGPALRAIRTVDSVTSSPGALAESHDHESRPATNKGKIEFVAVRADDLEGISHERLLVRSAFKAGITPSRIARQFGLSQTNVRKALASD